MPIIHLVDGQKGGVGKSLFTLVLCHYFKEKQNSFQLYDADKNQDVSCIYEGITDVHFIVSDETMAMNHKQASDVDRIFESALDQDVLVNLPSNIHESVAFWINSNSLLDEDVMEENGVRIIKWFLSDGSDPSLKALLESLNTYGERLPHVLVKNIKLEPDWDEIYSTEKYIKIRDFKIKEITFPVLRKQEVEFIREKNLPFQKVLDPQASSLSVLARTRIKKFIEQTSEQIQLGINGLPQVKMEES